MPTREVDALHREAADTCRIPVIVTNTPGEDSIGWEEFTQAFGGSVPSWEALSDEYHDALLTAARNEVPNGHDGTEAWLIFEDLVGSGLEFIFGRRVRRLGGRVRGSPVSDIVAQTPAQTIVVVDAKAGAEGFNVTRDALRPLREYTQRQQDRQRGHLSVSNALVVAAQFNQSDENLRERALEFNAAVGVPLAFLRAQALSSLVDLFEDRPHARNATRWSRILRGGAVSVEEVTEELEDIDNERLGAEG